MIRIGSVEGTTYDVRDEAPQLWVPRPRGAAASGSTATKPAA